MLTRMIAHALRCAGSYRFDDLSRLRGRNGDAHARRTPRGEGRHRSVPRVPRVLVRSVREPAARAAVDRAALSDDERAGDRSRTAGAHVDLSPLPLAAAPGA